MRNKSLFLALPMSSISSQEYLDMRGKINKLVIDLKSACKFETIYVAGDIPGKNIAFNSPSEAANRDLEAIKGCDLFVLIYPSSSPSSTIFEAGYAYAQQKKSIYLNRAGVQLPFLLRELPGVSCASFNDWDEIFLVLKRYIT